MTRQVTAKTLTIVFCLLSSCTHTEPARPHLETYLPDDASVPFDLQPLPASGRAQQRWLCSYRSQGKLAKFRIELGPASPMQSNGASEANFKSGAGKFIPEKDSDSTILLADLRKALQAKTQPLPPPTKSELTFDFVNLGENMSQLAGGGFTENPPGHWIAIKIFVGEGDAEGEVFLNLNPNIAKGQFAMKDLEYGDLVLSQLAKVL